MSIADNIRNLRNLMPPGVTLVAVSKFHPAETILQAYEAGQKVFGESRVQELLGKQKVLPKDISWHFIGHLQTNKVKQLIGNAALIESVDSEKLIDIIERESINAGCTSNILLQVHVAAEDTKFGFFHDEILDYFKSGRYQKLKATNICGIMGMATNTEDINRIKEDFHKIHSIYETLISEYSSSLPDFRFLSMGMSGDWGLALEEGANIVRIGSAIFGNRN